MPLGGGATQACGEPSDTEDDEDDALDNDYGGIGAMAPACAQAADNTGVRANVDDEAGGDDDSATEEEMNGPGSAVPCIAPSLLPLPSVPPAPACASNSNGTLPPEGNEDAESDSDSVMSEALPMDALGATQIDIGTTQIDEQSAAGIIADGAQLESTHPSGGLSQAAEEEHVGEDDVADVPGAELPVARQSEDSAAPDKDSSNLLANSCTSSAAATAAQTTKSPPIATGSCIEKAAVAAQPCVAPPSVETSESRTAKTQRAAPLCEVDRMMVGDLRAELHARGLSTTGKKKELADRLMAAISQGSAAASAPQVPPSTDIHRSAGRRAGKRGRSVTAAPIPAPASTVDNVFEIDTQDSPAVLAPLQAGQQTAQAAAPDPLPAAPISAQSQPVARRSRSAVCTEEPPAKHTFQEVAKGALTEMAAAAVSHADEVEMNAVEKKADAKTAPATKLAEPKVAALKRVAGAAANSTLAAGEAEAKAAVAADHVKAATVKKSPGEAATVKGTAAIDVDKNAVADKRERGCRKRGSENVENGSTVPSVEGHARGKRRCQAANNDPISDEKKHDVEVAKVAAGAQSRRRGSSTSGAPSGATPSPPGCASQGEHSQDSACGGISTSKRELSKAVVVSAQNVGDRELHTIRHVVCEMLKGTLLSPDDHHLEKCTHVVVGMPIRRTLKLAIAMSLPTVHLVNYSWVTACETARTFCSEKGHLLSGQHGDGEKSFDVTASRKAAAASRCFQGRSFYVTDKDPKSIERLKLMVCAAGGTMLDSPPTAGSPPAIVVSSPEESKVWKKLKKMPSVQAVVDVSHLVLCALRQELDLSQGTLD